MSRRNDDNTPLQPGPTAGRERLVHIDALRGLAILGIFPVNMLVFAYQFPYYTPLTYPGLTAADKIAEWLIVTFLQGAFYSLLSVLFGAGFALTLTRATTEDALVLRIGTYRRRLLLLFAIGVLHAILLWTGDILVTYALTGLIVINFHAHPNRSLLPWGVAGSLFSAAMVWLFSVGAGAPAGDFLAHMQQLQQAYAGGTFAEVTRARLVEFVTLVPGNIFAVPHLVALFFVGIGLVRRGVLLAPHAHRPFLRRILRVGLFVGVLGKLPHSYDIVATAGETIAPALVPLGPTVSALAGTVAFYFAGPALGFAFGAALLLGWSRPGTRPRTAFLAPVGRMAMTNYLTQSVVATSLFYGYGFGLYGQGGVARFLPFVLAVAVAQIFVSRWWLARFEYGPVEWVWRAATYGRFPRFRRRET